MRKVVAVALLVLALLGVAGLAARAVAATAPATYAEVGGTMGADFRIAAFCVSARPGEPAVVFGYSQEQGQLPRCSFVILVPAGTFAGLLPFPPATSETRVDPTVAASSKTTFTFGARKLEVALRCPIDRAMKHFTSRDLTIDGVPVEEGGARVLVLGRDGALHRVAATLPDLPAYRDADVPGFVRDAGDALLRELRDHPDVRDLLRR